jgi:hypothetical protein
LTLVVRQAHSAASAANDGDVVFKGPKPVMGTFVLQQYARQGTLFCTPFVLTVPLQMVNRRAVWQNG